nr:uncharacterized protein LOC112426992 [Macaca nemestrina]
MSFNERAGTLDTAAALSDGRVWGAGVCICWVQFRPDASRRQLKADQETAEGRWRLGPGGRGCCSSRNNQIGAEGRKYRGPLRGLPCSSCLTSRRESWEKPLSSFENPLSSWKKPLTSHEQPPSSWKKPPSPWEKPLSSHEQPLSSREKPLSSWEKFPSWEKPPYSQEKLPSSGRSRCPPGRSFRPGRSRHIPRRSRHPLGEAAVLLGEVSVLGEATIFPGEAAILPGESGILWEKLLSSWEKPLASWEMLLSSCYVPGPEAALVSLSHPSLLQGPELPPKAPSPCCGPFPRESGAGEAGLAQGPLRMFSVDSAGISSLLGGHFCAQDAVLEPVTGGAPGPVLVHPRRQRSPCWDSPRPVL